MLGEPTVRSYSPFRWKRKPLVPWRRQERPASGHDDSATLADKDDAGSPVPEAGPRLTSLTSPGIARPHRGILMQVVAYPPNPSDRGSISKEPSSFYDRTSTLHSFPPCVPIYLGV